MSTALSTALPTKSPKIATATVSKPPVSTDHVNDTFGNMDFLDFVPIDNNADDFDLGDIIATLDKNTNQQHKVEAYGDTQLALNPPKTVESTVTSNYTQNVTTHQTMQGFPMLPRNVFHNSNVTINYNFKS